ncbi:MAG: 50S ribosomal protein L18 [Phycisphaerales bacterium]
MNKQKLKNVRRNRRRIGIRKRIIGEPGRPRVAVFRSLNHFYAQVIDDMDGRTICAASSLDKGLGLSNTGNCDAAAAVGKAIAEKASAAGVASAVLDRGGFRYHGRVKAFADAAREAGLKL